MFSRRNPKPKPYDHNVRLNHWDQPECGGCRGLGRLFEDQQTYERQKPVKPFVSSAIALHQDVTALDDCATRGGCVACQVFRRALLLAQPTIAGIEDLKLRFAQRVVAIRLKDDLGASCLAVSISNASEKVEAVVVAASSRRSSYPRLLSGGPLNRQRFSPLRKWVSLCHNEHSCGNYKFSTRNPTWLIHIISLDAIRLVRGDSAAVDGGLVPYVALSYCWGNEQSVRARDPKAWENILRGHTTDAAARQYPFLVSELPRTLQDAINIVHELDIEYIWIDSVCVPKGSWDQEAHRMHEVYGNAHFTLAACSTANATDRMLVPQDAWRDDLQGCRLYGRWILNTDLALDDIRLQSPIAARGWILQEERLSPRILYWTSQRAYWACVQCQHIEAKQPGGSWSQGNWPDTGDDVDRRPQAFLEIRRNGSLEALRATWCDMVASYARRSMSPIRVVENRLAAFSGLAVRYLEATSVLGLRDEYLVGLWRGSIAQDLAWTVTKAALSQGSLQHSQAAEEGEVASQPGLPSWSWMSLPLCTEVEMQTQATPSSCFQIEMTSAALADDTDLEVVAKGGKVKALAVTGRLRPLIYDQFAAPVPWEEIERRAGNEGATTWYDFSLDPRRSVFARHDDGRILVYEPHKEEIITQLDYLVNEDEIDTIGVPKHRDIERSLQCLELGVSAMLLLHCIDSASETYRRVGVSIDYRDGFFEGASVQCIRLT